MAELKLGVSFDLVYFRQQLDKLGRIAASEFTAPIKIKLDRQVVDRELNNLQRLIKRRTYKVELNVAGGLSKKTFDDLQERLDALSNRQKVEIPLSVKNGATGKEISEAIAALRARIGQNQTLRQGDGKLRIGASIKPSITNADVADFKREVKQKFSELSVKVKAELDTAPLGTSQGALGGSSRTFLQELKDLDKGTLQDVYRAAAKDALLAFDEGIINNKAKIAQALNEAASDANAGFIAALQDKKSALFQAAGEYANALLGGLKKTLKIQSPSREMFDIGDDAGKGFELGLLKAMELAEKSATNQMRRMLDRLARMALMMGGMSAEQINRQVAQAKVLPSLNFPATVPPRQRVPIGPSDTGRALPAGRAAAGLIRGAQAPAGLLPSVTMQGSLSAGLEALVQALVAQARGMGPATSGAIVSMETGFIPAMRERFAKVAKNYLFGIETKVVDLFDAVLRQVESAVDLHIARIEGQISQRLRSLASVTDLGVRGLPMLPGAATGRAPLMLPPAGGTTPLGQMRFNAVRTSQFAPTFPLALPPAGGTTPPSQMRFNAVTTGASRARGGYMPPGGFPEESMLGGRQGPATFIGAGSQMEKFKTGLDVASQSMKKFRASQIPLIGGLKDMATEFGFALKQVLLFGTAYRGLAFVQSLPRQILDATRSQQQYNNALQTATQDTGTFAKELLYVDNVQRAFGLNLETTRNGFTKLYASMAPTGFDSGSIEKLFTGISAATAALQLTPDKAERVINAFGQMASKGQVMSEELKGQLGDVLPGALAIFADAAGMSVKEFSKAMEDGVFVGSKFRETFAQVSDELMRRFGTGAQAAAKSLQGLLSTVQGDFTRVLESFAPLADAAAKAVLEPLSQSLSQLSKAASLAFGEQERVSKQLQRAKIDGANAQSIAALEAKLSQLNDAARDPAIANQAKDIENFVTEVTKAARAVSDFAGGVGSILGPVFVSLGTNLTGIVNTLGVLALSFAVTRTAAMLTMGTLATMNAIVQAGGSISNIAAARATILAGALRLVGVQATGAQVATIGFGTALKGLLASTGIGLVVVLLGSLATAFLNVGNKAAEAAERTKAAMTKMQDAIRSGNVEIAKADLYQTQRQRQAVEDSVSLLDRLEQKARRTGRGGTQRYAQTTLAERMQLEAAGYDLGGRTEVDLNALRGQTASLRSELTNLEQRQRVGVSLAEQQRQKIGLNEPKPTVVEDPSAADATKGKRERQLRDFNSEAIEQLRTNQRIAEEKLQQQRQLEIIDETEYAIASAANKRKYELLIIEEALAQKKASIDEYKVDVRKKQLAVFEQLAANEEKLVEEEYKTAVKGAELKLSRPFKEGLRDENIEIRKQLLLMGNLRAGYSELTPEQEANLIIEEKTKELRARQQKLIQAEIDGLRQATIERIKGAKALEREMALLKLRNDALQLRAPLGRERLVELMQRPGYTEEQAQAQFMLEEQNRRLQVFRQGATDLAGTINSSIGDALTNIATDFENLQQHGLNFIQTLANAFKQLANTIIQEMTRAMISKAVGSLFGFAMPGAGASAAQPGLTAGIQQYPLVGSANGNVLRGGFQAFANGGVVSGPTLGLIGEGRFNEAVVPLPDGRRIPVDLGGAAGSNISTNIVVNMNNGQASSQMTGNGGQALGRELEGAVRSVLLKESRPGGIIYSQR